MLHAAVKRALQIIKSPHATGKTIGAFAGGAAIGRVITGVARHYEAQTQEVVNDSRGNSFRMTLTKQCDICHDDTYGVNADGRGTPIGAIYADADGRLYKRVGFDWYQWNGAEWV